MIPHNRNKDLADKTVAAVAVVVAAATLAAAHVIARQVTKANHRLILAVAKLMANEPITTTEVWHMLSDQLRTFLRSRVSQLAQEDLLQEIFLRVHHNLPSLKEPARIESWVFQIARNVVIDYYRRNQTWKEQTTEMEPQEEIPDQSLNQAIAGWLLHLIEMLPEKQRDAVRMYEIEGMSQQEIANRSGISLSGAKSRVQRGRDQLSTLLRECCEFELDRRGNVIDCQSVNRSCCGSSECDCEEDSCS